MNKNSNLRNNLCFTAWFGTLFAIAFILSYPSTHTIFVSATKAHPYIMGFIKVAILATMGELMALRIVAGEWKKPVGLPYRVFVWGLLGMAFVIVFDIFAGGVAGAMSKALLPTSTDKTVNQVLFAFFTSSFMNLVFAPTFMLFHRVTDTFIDLGEGRMSKIARITLGEVVDKIDFHGFISFVVIKTIPIFWIPAHTVTFMLAPEYRVLMASFLSIAMGGILAFAKRRKPKSA
ncbi:MAG TPA: hypothetical protein VEG39_05865 [Clostridia bacterium]|nr:hypothetical protein [Clostridia bacterium]